MSREGMTRTVIASELAEAIKNDGGYSLNQISVDKVIFGLHVSGFIRNLAEEICKVQDGEAKEEE